MQQNTDIIAIHDALLKDLREAMRAQHKANYPLSPRMARIQEINRRQVASLRH